MSDIEQKRAFVAEMYPGPRWKKQVARMPDSQVFAIYMREIAKPKDEPEDKESKDDGLPF
jgi:hypothetical protein